MHGFKGRLDSSRYCRLWHIPLWLGWAFLWYRALQITYSDKMFCKSRRLYLALGSAFLVDFSYCEAPIKHVVTVRNGTSALAPVYESSCPPVYESSCPPVYESSCPPVLQITDCIVGAGYSSSAVLSGAEQCRQVQCRSVQRSGVQCSAVQ